MPFFRWPAFGRAHFRSDRREAVWRKANGFCFYCGEPLVIDSVGVVDSRFPDSLCLPSRLRWMQIDHVTPRCQGGSNREHNLQPTCGSCNAQKGRKSLNEYRAWVARKTGQRLVVFFGELSS